MQKELTNKQQAFIQEYCSNGYNASQAYKMAYPDCKAGHNALGARLIANDSIKQVIEDKKAEMQAISEHNYQIAIDKLLKRLAYIQKAAESGNIQAVQVQLAILRELDDISGLHKQTITSRTEPAPEPSQAEQQALAATAHDFKLRLAENSPDVPQDSQEQAKETG